MHKLFFRALRSSGNTRRLAGPLSSQFNHNDHRIILLEGKSLQTRRFSDKPPSNNSKDKESTTADKEQSTITTSNEDVAQVENQASSPPSSSEGQQPPTTNNTETTPPPAPSLSSSASSYYGATVQRIGSTLYKAEQRYEDFEKQIMATIRESSQRRFRMYFFGSIAGIVAIVVIFGQPIKEAVTQQTADIAQETLQNESLKIQTQELAMAVIQTVLNDKEITAHAANFLKEASTSPETQKALLSLTLHVLQHPQTMDELLALSKRLIHNLTHDKQVVQELADVFIEVLHDPNLQDVAVKVLAKLFQEPEIIQAALDLLLTVAQKNEVKLATVDLAQTISTEVLEDKQIVTQSRQFIADVMGDDVLQKEGGNALMNTVYHALKPGVMRMVGCGLVCVSVAALRLFLSPF